jgi:sulfite exporter TauE/SafE
MIALISAVFLASLLGSMHCAGMCGAFVAFAVGGHGERPVSRAALNVAYNSGRLVTYTILGAIAGALGAAMDLGGSMVGVQRAAAVVAGAMMIAFGATALLRAAGLKAPRLPLPGLLHKVVAAGHRVAFDLPPLARAGVVGLLTTLLPCGWLYAFAITAAGTGSPWMGALTMMVFWLGTLPVLIAIGVGVQALTGALRPHLPLATSLLIVVVGAWTVFGRVKVPALDLHADGSTMVSVEQAALRVESLNSEEMPCCNDHQ